jgi:hypothetical protein
MGVLLLSWFEALLYVEYPIPKGLAQHKVEILQLYLAKLLAITAI